MFRFEFPYHLSVWVAIPVLALLMLWLIRHRKNLLKRWGDKELLLRITPQYSRMRAWWRLGLVAMALLFLGLAWANPQWGLKREKTKRKSSDVFIALDISRSMNTEDLAPSRLERSKKFARKLVGKLKGERIGVIIFAGNAYLQSPLTIDYSSADQFIDAASSKQVVTQGTAIDAAITLALLSFGGDNEQHKALIIISDGENHSPGAVAKAKEAQAKGMMVFTVGAGTQEGGYIPVKMGAFSDYQRDGNGELVRSRINEDMLAEIAEVGGGEYYNILSGEDAVLAALEKNIEQIEKREFEQRMFDEYESYFWVFLIPALLFLSLDFLWPDRKVKAWVGTA